MIGYRRPYAGRRGDDGSRLIRILLRRISPCPARERTEDYEQDLDEQVTVKPPWCTLQEIRGREREGYHVDSEAYKLDQAAPADHEVEAVGRAKDNVAPEVEGRSPIHCYAFEIAAITLPCIV